MRLSLIANCHAGHGQIMKSRDAVQEALEAPENELHWISTESPEQARQALRKEREWAELLVCSGGDGTLSAMVDFLLQGGGEIPALGYLPAGTTNDFANTLGLVKDPVRAARQMLEAVPRPLDVGSFGYRHFIYVASFGAFTQASYQVTQNLKNTLGHMAYVVEGLKELPQLKSYHVCVEAGEKSYEGDYVFGSVTNSTSLGGMIKLDRERVKLDDGLMELSLVRMPKNLYELHRIIVSLMSGKIDEELITFVPVSRAVFTCCEPMPWSLDGDYAAGGEKIAVEVLPGAIELRF